MKKTIPTLLLIAALLLTACGGDETANTSGGSGSSDKGSAKTSSTASKGGSTTTAPKPSQSGDGTQTAGEGDPSQPEFTVDDADVFIAKGTPEVDGIKDEIWNSTQAVTLELIKKDNPSPETVVKASALWDENSIYFLFEITDSQIFNGGSVGDYNNDGIYLYIAESLDIYAATAEDYGHGAYQFALISPELEMLPRKGDTGTDLNAHSSYKPTTDGMIIEFSYSFTDGELANGSFIALDYQYNDCETAGTRLGAYGWYNGTDGDFNTNDLAIGMLCDTLPQA